MHPTHSFTSLYTWTVACPLWKLFALICLDLLTDLCFLPIWFLNAFRLLYLKSHKSHLKSSLFLSFSAAVYLPSASKFTLSLSRASPAASLLTWSMTFAFALQWLLQTLQFENEQLGVLKGWQGEIQDQQNSEIHSNNIRFVFTNSFLGQLFASIFFN